MNANAPRERRYAAQDGLQLFFRDWGEPDWPATPLLCLPGLTRNSRDFAGLAGELSHPTQERPRRVIAPDLRGRGRSACDPDWRNYNARTYLDDIRHLLALLGIARVVVVGISMGGLLGMAMATAMPTALAGLVIDDIGPTIESGGSGRILNYVSADRPQPDWPSAARHLREVLPAMSLRDEDEWLDFARATFREGDDGLLHFDWDTNLVRSLSREISSGVDLWALWRALGKKPVLVIRGGVSDILSEATLARMAVEKPDLRQFTLPGVGHAPTLNEPPVREVIHDFLGQF